MSGGHYGYQHQYEAADYAGRACGTVKLCNIADDLEEEGYGDIAKAVRVFRADMEAYAAKGEALDQLYIDLKYPGCVDTVTDAVATHRMYVPYSEKVTPDVE